MKRYPSLDDLYTEQPDLRYPHSYVKKSNWKQFITPNSAVYKGAYWLNDTVPQLYIIHEINDTFNIVKHRAAGPECEHVSGPYPSLEVAKIAYLLLGGGK